MTAAAWSPTVVQDVPLTAVDMHWSRLRHSDSAPGTDQFLWWQIASAKGGTVRAHITQRRQFADWCAAYSLVVTRDGDFTVRGNGYVPVGSFRLWLDFTYTELPGDAGSAA